MTKQRFNAKFSAKTFQELRKLSKNTRLSMSELVRRLIAQAKPQDFADES